VAEANASAVPYNCECRRALPRLSLPPGSAPGVLPGAASPLTEENSHEPTDSPPYLLRHPDFNDLCTPSRPRSTASTRAGATMTNPSDPIRCPCGRCSRSSARVGPSWLCAWAGWKFPQARAFPGPRTSRRPDSQEQRLSSIRYQYQCSICQLRPVSWKQPSRSSLPQTTLQKARSFPERRFFR
jgi:hypothetical protein